MRTRGKAIYYKDGRQIDEEDAYEESGMIKDGVRMHVPLMMCDSAGNLLIDALGEPLPAKGHVSGYVFVDRDYTSREQNRQLRKAELSNAWRGGLSDGDFVRLGDRHMEVTGRNPANGKVQLTDPSTLDGDIEKRAAYNDSVADLTNAWKTQPVTDQEPGDSCTTKDGQKGKYARGADGRLFCKPNGGNTKGASKILQNEWDLSGPLSDAQEVEINEIKNQAWLDSVEALQSAWRK